MGILFLLPDFDSPCTVMHLVTCLPLQKLAELMDKGHPLLDPSVQCRDGAVFMPGNTTLASLNLAGQSVTVVMGFR